VDDAIAISLERGAELVGLLFLPPSPGSISLRGCRGEEIVL
jgi:hypothetical protein